MVRMIVGPVAGAAVGFVYYKFIGCSSGACPITSNPWASMIYGAILGFMIAGMGNSN
ncbi:MAG: YtxH domain-containing protein [Candidatus Latescibacteria bacterium]|nr:YtxH domain-containing protein [Candidatus Latescibacterota bacterium]